MCCRIDLPKEKLPNGVDFILKIESFHCSKNILNWNFQDMRHNQ